MNEESQNKKVVLTAAQPTGRLHLGNYLGARYAIRGGSKKIRNMMFVVLALLFIKMGYELLF